MEHDSKRMGSKRKKRTAVERKALEAWESLHLRRRPDLCSNLVDSLPKRFQDVEEAGGGWRGH